MPTLNWIGKEAVVDHHRHIPTRLLECDPKLSFGEPDAENLLVEGDNLEALKALLPRYRGQVKCIYIDPPYNTGNENWVYNDNVNDPRIKKWLGQVVGKEAEDLCRHDKWLCMMYPRLSLLREFLREDGSIFVSIDDNEAHCLRTLMDDVFGVSNFVVNMIWQKMDSPSSNYGNRSFSVYHDHTLVYARDASKCALKPQSKSGILDAFPDVDNSGRRCRLRQLRKNGKAARRQDRETMWYPIIDPDGEELWPIHPDEGWEGRWTVGRKKYEELVLTGQLEWKKRPYGWMAYTIEYPPDDPTIPNPSILIDAGQNRQAKAVLNDMLGSNHGFETPKPKELVRRIISIAASEPDSIILDSFAGSGTTAHAVLEANKQDGGQRRFICIELIPEVAQKLTAARTIVAISGRKADGSPWETEIEELLFEQGLNQTSLRKGEETYAKFAQIKADRRSEFERFEVRFPAKAVQLWGIKRIVANGLGSGFRYCKLGRTLLDEFGDINGEVPFTDLARYVYLLETGVPVPKRPKKDCPLLGVHQGRAIYLLYNGVLGDRRPAGGNVLTNSVLAGLPPHPEGKGSRVIFGEATRLSESTLARENIVFRQIPYSLRES